MNVSITPGQRRGAAEALRSLGRTTMPVVAIVGTVADASNCGAEVINDD